MTVQELQEIMNQRFDRVEDDMKELRADMKELREKMDADMKELREKLDKLLELQHYQRGQREFSSRFLKHAAWVGPTIIALIALLKSFF